MHTKFFTSILLILFVHLLSADQQSTKSAYQDGLNKVSYYETAQGNLLRYTLFETPREKKGTVVFIQGRGTFLEFYEVLVTPLLERGYDVWMNDLSGQGGSSRLLTKKHDNDTVQFMQHVDSFDVYLKDTHGFISEIVLPNCKQPLILGGYSTGGHLALRYAQSFPKTPFEAVFVISPLLSLKAPVPHSVLSTVFWSASWMTHLERYIFGATHKDPIHTMPYSENPYTSNPEAFSEIVNLCIQHPELMMGGASMGWIHAALTSVKELWKHPAKIQVPVLLATGGDDGVVDVSYNASFCSLLKHAKHVFYPHGRHELFREENSIKDALWSDFDAFMNTK